MSPAVAWALTGVALAAAVVLVVRLWRTPGPWKTEHYLTALGLVVVVVLAAAPHLFPADDGEESEEVRRYRLPVQTACESIVPTGNPVEEAWNEDGTLDRGRLENGYRNQLATADGVLAALWARPVPAELTEDATAARAASDALSAATRGKLDLMADELPRTISSSQWADWWGSFGAVVGPPGTEFEVEMSALADDECRPPATQQPAT